MVNPAHPTDDQKILQQYRFRACTDQLSLCREQVRRSLRKLGCSEAYIEPLVLAVDEAMTNVIRHAYCQDEAGEIILEIRKRGDSLVFRMIDFAPSIDVAKIKQRDLSEIKPGGLGMHIMQQIMDKLEFVVPPDGKGNILEMTKRLEH